MSCGERSCKHYGSCPGYSEKHLCCVDCPHYLWDGKTKTDSPAVKYIFKDIKKQETKNPLPPKNRTTASKEKYPTLNRHERRKLAKTGDIVEAQNNQR